MHSNQVRKCNGISYYPSIHQKGRDFEHSQQQQSNTIPYLMNKRYTNLVPNIFHFKHSRKAPLHNTSILSKYKFDYDTMLAATNSNTNLEYGSEFRPASELEVLLSIHPLWSRTKQILTKGVNVSLTPMETHQIQADTAAGTKRGNHKG